MVDFPKHGIDSDKKEAAEILQSVKNAYGFVPDLFSYMAEAPVTIKAYLDLLNAVDQSSLTAQQAQIIQLAISKENGCGFCETAHTAMAKMKNANRQSIEAVINGEEIADPKDRALVDLALNVVRNRGWVEDADLQAFFAAGFSHQQVLEVILCVTIKTLSNFSNHLTKPVANPELVQGAAA